MHIAENLLRGVINYYLFWTGHSAKSSPEDYIGNIVYFELASMLGHLLN